MKKILPILTVVCAVVFMFNGKKYDELVSSRLSSDVAICLQGESCGQAVLAATSSSAAGDHAQQNKFIQVDVLLVMMLALQEHQCLPFKVSGSKG